MIVLIYGLPGTGKTALAKQICARTDSVHINADEVRADLSSDLGFSDSDRLEQARRMGAVARIVSASGKVAVVDFVCPTRETRLAFGKADFTVWVDRIDESRYEDTNKVWQRPTPDEFDLRIGKGLTLDQEVDACFVRMRLPSWKSPTTLMLGRYQPWHEGHRALYEEAKKSGNQVVIGVRNTGGTSEKDPFEFEKVAELIKQDVPNAFVVQMPNIVKIVYGRDVGYSIEKISLGEDVESISATQKRKDMGI